MLDRLYWTASGQILMVEFSGEVSLKDVEHLSSGMEQAIEAAKPEDYVDLLLDMSRVTKYSSDVFNIRKLFSSVRKHEKTRWHIIIDPHANRVLDFVVRTVSQMLRARVRFVASLEEAMDFVHIVQATNK